MNVTKAASGNTEKTSDQAAGEITKDNHSYLLETLSNESGHTGSTPDTLEAGGVAEVEGIQAVWGKRGKYFLWAGLALLMVVYELDNSTVYVYQSYAPSTFNALSQKATLSTAATIVAAVAKPPIAKLSDVIGRANTYCITISCYVLAYILCSTSQTFAAYAVGIIVYAVGQTGTNILNDIIISDITSARWRTFGLAISFFPFLIMPWVSAFIVDAVVNGIGWRWGIGMFGFIMPPCASLLILTLFHYQRKAKRLGVVKGKTVSVPEFFSLVDFGGLSMLCAGFAMFFLPIDIASATPSSWKTGWVIALIVLGACILVALVPYEAYVAKHPILPPRYFRNISIVLAIGMGFLDALAFSASHAYLYSWVVVAHDYGVTKATFFTYVNGVVQSLVGMVVGLLIFKLGRYKWTLFTAAVIRTIGYGLMIRLRGQNNSDAELFIVQVIQGLGSGVIQIVCITIGQINVPHAELAQVSALILLAIFLGSGVGSAVAGAIYTNYFKEALRSQLGSSASSATIDKIYNSIIASDLPAWGTAERVAANAAYSDVMRYISIAALAVSAPVIIFAFFLPNTRLPDRQNLVEGSRLPNVTAGNGNDLHLSDS